MSSSTSSTPIRQPRGASTVRTGMRAEESVVSVQFGVWGPQEVSVRASSGGGRGGAPYVVVQVAGCLTYAYDRAAVDSHLLAWRDAEQVNRTVRLPELPPTSGARGHAGEDLGVLCTVSAVQPRSVTGSTGPDGRPLITVTVGAVTVEVHTTTALRSCLVAWRKAGSASGLLKDARDAD